MDRVSCLNSRKAEDARACITDANSELECRAGCPSRQIHSPLHVAEQLLLSVELLLKTAIHRAAGRN